MDGAHLSSTGSTLRRTRRWRRCGQAWSSWSRPRARMRSLPSPARLRPSASRQERRSCRWWRLVAVRRRSARARPRCRWAIPTPSCATSPASGRIGCIRVAVDPQNLV